MTQIPQGLIDRARHDVVLYAVLTRVELGEW